MTRICITGGPRTGKTTLAGALFEQHGWPHAGPDCDGCGALRHTDDLIGKLDWSAASAEAATWFDAPGPWIIEGVSVSRALRKWREAHPGEPPPVDRIVRLTRPHVDLAKGQATMAKGEQSVWNEIAQWVADHCELHVTEPDGRQIIGGGWRRVAQ